MREIQRYRRHAVQVFVGLQVSNDSFPRFHIEDIIRTVDFMIRTCVSVTEPRRRRVPSETHV